MVAEKEVMQKEEEPFPEPTPEERKLPLGKRGELAAPAFWNARAMRFSKQTGPALRVRRTSSPWKTIRFAL